MLLPLELSNKIQDYIRPTEGFKIKEGQHYNINDEYTIFITNVEYKKNKIIVRGGRLLNNEFCGFCLFLKKQLNKYHDMAYPRDSYGSSFKWIVLSKTNLIK